MERSLPSPGSLYRWLLVPLLALAGLLALAQPAAADGIIIPRPPIDRPTLPWRNIPISIKYHRVDVTIQNQVATTHVDQVFVNNANFPVEGTYIFPLPEDAAISSFDMTVDGVKYEGKLLGREEARAIYEDIVRRQRDPALLEYVGRGAFQASIFPIPPGGERRIELTYAQVLSQQGGLVHYRYPLNTEKFSARPIPEVAITVRVEDKAPLRAIYSPSHPVDVTRQGPRSATVGYEARDVRPDRDFDLYYSVSQDTIAVNLLSYRGVGEDGFFLLLVTPRLEVDQAPVARDVVLVFDTSGSMEGQKIQQAKTAANYVLDHLGPDDRFNIVAFSTATKLFADAPQPLARRGEARTFIEGLRASGSTDINRALLEATAGLDKERPTVVIFLTDGLPTAGETNPDRIVAAVTDAAPKSVRLFAFGVGYDVDTVLLDQLSSRLRGTSGYVKPDQAIDEQVSAFYSTISAPVLVDVGVSFAGVKAEDMYPYPLPDLFAGSQLVVAGRYRQGGPATLTLTGEVNGKPQSFQYGDLQFVDRGGNEFIPQLWAQRKIGHLLAQIRLRGTNDELVKEVVDLSTRYGIVTPYTSFLVQEPQQALTEAGRRQLTESLQAPSLGRGGGGPAPAATAAPAAAPLASDGRTGAKAVERSVAENQLSSQAYAGSPAAPEQVRQMGDKAFVLHDQVWTDTSFDQDKTRAEEVAFGSDRYFQLLQQHPEIAPYLALGDRVTLVIGGQAYAVGPAGATAAQPVPSPQPPAPTEQPMPQAAATPAEATPQVLAQVVATAPVEATPGLQARVTATAPVEPTPQVLAQVTGAPASPAQPPPPLPAPALPAVCTAPAGAALLGMLLPLWLRRRHS